MSGKPVEKVRGLPDSLGRRRWVYLCRFGHWHTCDRHAHDCNARRRLRTSKRLAADARVSARATTTEPTTPETFLPSENQP